MFVLILSYWSCSRLWKLWQPESFLAWFMQAPVWIGGYPQSKQHSIIFQQGYKHAFPSFLSIIGAMVQSKCIFWTAQAGNLVWSNYTACGGFHHFESLLRRSTEQSFPWNDTVYTVGTLGGNPGTPLMVSCVFMHICLNQNAILNFKSATKNTWLIGIVYHRVPPLFTSPDPCVAAPISSHCSGQSNPWRGSVPKTGVDHKIVAKYFGRFICIICLAEYICTLIYIYILYIYI